MKPLKVMTGKDVKAMRLRYGLTQEDFGRALGYARPKVSCAQLESGARPITGQTRIILEYIRRHGPIDTVLPNKDDRGKPRR